MTKTKQPPAAELLSVNDAAAMPGISRSEFYEWRKAEVIPDSLCVNGVTRWRRRELRDWVIAGCPNPRSWRWEPTIPCDLQTAISLKREEFRRTPALLSPLGVAAVTVAPMAFRTA